MLIVIDFLQALLVLIAFAGKTAGHSIHVVYDGDLTKGAGALASYQVDTATLAKDIFGLSATSENDSGKIWNRIQKLILSSFILFC